MDLASLFSAVGAAPPPDVFSGAAPGAAEMLRIVLSLVAIVGCGSVVVALVSRREGG